MLKIKQQFYGRTKFVYSSDRLLSTPFRVIGTEWIIADVVDRDAHGLPYSPGLPAEGSERLVFVANGKLRVVDTVEQLRGTVRLASPSEALAFVRLDSSVTTFFLFQHSSTVQYLDVIDKSKLSQYKMCGETQDLRDCDHGIFGVVNHRTYASLQIPDAVAKTTPDGYYTERPVVYFAPVRSGEWKANRVSVLRQHVRFDGGIANLERRDLPQSVAHGVNWAMPVFE